MARILIVEDNDFNRDVLRRTLQKRFHEVYEAIDGRQGVEEAKRLQPDLIVLDMSMPVMTGWEAAGILKADESTAHIPILALTAYAMKEDREKALASGCDEYDTKPIERARLLPKIDDLLRLAQALDSAEAASREVVSREVVSREGTPSK